jgi:hypothetical protein
MEIIIAEKADLIWIMEDIIGSEGKESKYFSIFIQGKRQMRKLCDSRIVNQLMK